MKLVHWPLMDGCYIWYSDEGTGQGRSSPRPLLAVPNVTAHPSTASVPITVLLYNGPLLCGFNVVIKGLTILLSAYSLTKLFCGQPLALAADVTVFDCLALN